MLRIPVGTTWADWTSLSAGSGSISSLQAGEFSSDSEICSHGGVVVITSSVTSLSVPSSENQAHRIQKNKEKPNSRK